MSDRVVELAREMSQTREIVDRLKNEMKDLNARIDEIRFTELPDAMDDAGIESIRVAGVGTVYLTDELNVSISDKPKGYEWLREHGYGDLIQDYAFPQSVKALVKEQSKKGVIFPEDLFKVSPFTRATIKSA